MQIWNHKCGGAYFAPIEFVIFAVYKYTLAKTHNNRSFLHKLLYGGNESIWNHKCGGAYFAPIGFWILLAMYYFLYLLYDMICCQRSFGEMHTGA